MVIASLKNSSLEGASKCVTFCITRNSAAEESSISISQPKKLKHGARKQNKAKAEKRISTGQENKTKERDKGGTTYRGNSV